MSFSNLLMNDFLDHSKGSEKNLDFYTFNFYTFKNYTFESVVVSAHALRLLPTWNSGFVWGGGALCSVLIIDCALIQLRHISDQIIPKLMHLHMIWSKKIIGSTFKRNILKKIFLKKNFRLNLISSQNESNSRLNLNSSFEFSLKSCKNKQKN